MKKKVLILLLFFLMTLAGCSDLNTSEQPNQADTVVDEQAVRMQLAIPVAFIDPAYVQNESEINIARLVFQGLVMETAAGEVIPCAAQSWQVSQDKKTYVFHLHKGIRFHNGKLITADDFKFSWERVLRLNAPAAYLFANIQGAQEVLGGQQKLASGIVASDDYTLTVSLSRPQDNFISSLTHPAAAVLDRYEVVEQGINFAKAGSISQPAMPPSGIGPFRLVEWIDGCHLTIGRNSQYFGKAPQLSRVDFQMNMPTGDELFDFAAGRTDILQELIPEELAKVPAQIGKIELVEKPVQRFRYLGMNASLPPFDVKEVRDAVAYGLNREGILKSVRGESGAEVPGLITDYWYGKNSSVRSKYQYDPLMALTVLESSGYPGGEGLPELTLYCGPAVEDMKAAGEIKKILTLSHFKIRIQSVTGKDLRRLIKNGEAAFYITDFSAKSPELDNFFQEQIDSRWQKTIVNPLWDQKLDAASSLDGESRITAYRQLEISVLDDNRIIYLYSYKTAAAVSHRLKDLQFVKGGGIDFQSLSVVSP